MSGRNLILAVILALQCAALVFLAWPQRPQGGDNRALWSLDAAKIERMEITDNSQTTLALVKRNGEWVVHPPDDYPGDGPLIEKRLAALARIEAGPLVSRTRSGQQRLKVAENNFNRRIVLQEAGGAAHTIYLGTSQGDNGLHVRLDGEDEVYLVTGLTIWDYGTSSRTWWRRHYVDVDPEKVTAVKIANERGEFKLERDGDRFLVDGVEKDPDKARALLRAVSRIAVADYVRPPEGADGADGSDQTAAPVATVTLTTADDTITYTVGPADDAKEHLVRVAGRELAAKVSRWDVKQILEIEPDGLPDREAEQEQAQKQEQEQEEAASGGGTGR